MSIQEDYSIGENPGIDLRAAASDYAGSVINGETSPHISMDFGEHGEFYTHEVKAIEPDEAEGHLRIYLNHAKDPKVFAVIALGIVLAGLAHRRYRKN